MWRRMRCRSDPKFIQFFFVLLVMFAFPFISYSLLYHQLLSISSFLSFCFEENTHNKRKSDRDTNTLLQRRMRRRCGASCGAAASGAAAASQ
jgi:hypothetical protein